MTELLISKDIKNLGQTELISSPIAYGLWRFSGTDVKNAQSKIECALESGIHLFDEADIYGVDGGGSFGDSESMLGRVLSSAPSLREKMTIASKGGIVLGVPYNSSAKYLREAVDASLKRMGIECIDLYQIHRPDFLGNPYEIAALLTELRGKGKIREVGVSNYSPSQFRALQAHFDFPIATHQPEMSCLNYSALRDGVLDQCMELGVTPLAWSPVAGGQLAMSIESAQQHPTGERLVHLLTVLDRIAEEQSVSRTSVALAWLMVHPAGIIPIIGTQNLDRIRQTKEVFEIKLTRVLWNEILVAAQGEDLP